MEDYARVEVVSEFDGSGNAVPRKIVWGEGKAFGIQRVISVCQPEDKMTMYTVLVEGRQRKLFFNGSEWRVRKRAGADKGDAG